LAEKETSIANSPERGQEKSETRRGGGNPSSFTERMGRGADMANFQLHTERGKGSNERVFKFGSSQIKRWPRVMKKC